MKRSYRHGYRQQIDLSGPVGPLIASLLFGIAEIELQHVKERQAIGIALAKKDGVYTGRKPGTTKAKPSRALTLKKQGLTIVEIAQALDVRERALRRGGSLCPRRTSMARSVRMTMIQVLRGRVSTWREFTTLRRSAPPCTELHST
jgi:DNA invertase Pin-like site-specific DNA recombinase